MSDIGLIMDTLLGLLLVGALAVGWRLEGRLKVLKASHQSFTQAVADLDRAAARAEQGLSDLRAATDEAAETLAARIDRAGALSGRLEKLTSDAALAEARLIAAPRPQAARQEPARADPARHAAVAAEPPRLAEARPAEARPVQTRESAFARFAERYGAKVAQPVSALAEAAARNDLILEDDDDLEAPAHVRAPALARRIAPEAVARIERLQALARTPASLAKPRAPVEDELFDAPAPRAAAGGRR
jgi:hypothetical protein